MSSDTWIQRENIQPSIVRWLDQIRPLWFIITQGRFLE